MHMGLHIKSSDYACWRDETHRGKSPVRVIQALLGCSWDEAKQLAHTYFNWVGSRPVKQETREAHPVAVPEDFIEFGTDAGLEAQFIKYILSRGVDPVQAISRYDLRWAITGPFAYRLIIPIISEKKWFTWIARAITPTLQGPKYLAAGEDFTVNRPNDFLFNADNLSGGRALLLCEGSWDAIKINSSFIPGVHAAALCGKVLTEKQLKALLAVAGAYTHVIVGLDQDALKDSLALQSRLSWYSLNVGMVSPSAKDWGELPTAQIKKEILTYVEDRESYRR
jgi:DNA primase